MTQDNVLLSGHCRLEAAREIGLTEVPVEHRNISYAEDPDGCIRLIVEYNRQRPKTRTEMVREAGVALSPEDAWRALKCARQEQAEAGGKLRTFDAGDFKARDRITSARSQFLAAVQTVLEENRDYLPMSDRQVHYRLLNARPLIHARKPKSAYRNDEASYRALTKLLTQARLEGSIPMDALCDETRPVALWRTWNTVGEYLEQVMPVLLTGYRRDVQRSQPHHVELFAEKLTLRAILNPLADEYSLPLTIGRGFVSLPPRAGMADRWRASGKAALILLAVADADPEGDEITRSLARSLQYEFHVPDVRPVRVALTPAQARAMGLPSLMTAKRESSRYEAFKARHSGDSAWEVESLAPPDLQRLLREAIKAALDVPAFNAEVAAEKEDARALSGLRSRMIEVLKDAREEEGL